MFDQSGSMVGLSSSRLAVALAAGLLAGCAAGGATRPPLVDASHDQSRAAGIGLPNVVQPPGNNGFERFTYASVLSPACHFMIPGPKHSIWFPTNPIAGKTSSIAAIDMPGTLKAVPVPLPTGQFQDSASGLTVGSDKNLWFAESDGQSSGPQTGHIGRVTPSGQFTLFSLPPGAGPADVATGSDGNVWFVDNMLLKVGVITPNGQVMEFPPPSAPLLTNSLWSIVAGPDGSLWFPESSNHIGRITTSGQVTEFPLPSTLTGPGFLVAGPTALYFFVQTQTGTGIAQIDTSGAVTVLSNAVTGPLGMAFANGLLWFAYTDGFYSVIESYNPKTRSFSAPIEDLSNSGHPIEVLGGGPDSNVWMAYGTASISVYDHLAMTASPSSLSFAAPGTNQTLTISETNYRGTFGATSSDPSVATVSPAKRSTGAFTVTAVGAGNATITVRDAKLNSVPVIVSVQ
jgi:streptogramin lyase